MRVSRIKRAGQLFGGLLLAISVVISITIPASASAAPGVAWEVFQLSTPTVLIPGSEASESSLGAKPKYRIIVTNVGGVASESLVIVSDELPSGLTPSAAPLARYRAEGGNQSEFAEEPCAVTGNTVECEVTRSITPGETIEVIVPLAVAAGASGEVANRVSVTSAEADPVTSEGPTTIGSQVSPFDFSPGLEGLRGSALDAAGDPATAGSHPYSLTFSAYVNSVIEPETEALVTSEPLRSLGFSLPPGVVFNPLATPVRCKRSAFEGSGSSPSRFCPVLSQVGEVKLNVLRGLETISAPIYNLQPEAGVPAELGFQFLKIAVRIRGGLDGAFRLTAGSSDLLTKYTIGGLRAELWGNPSDPGHDAIRFGESPIPPGANPDIEETNVCRSQFGCSVEPSEVPLLTMPSSCESQLEFLAAASGWLGSAVTANSLLRTASGAVAQVEGCSRLAFAPTIDIQPVSRSTETPSGLGVDIKVPQNENYFGLASSTLKKAVIRLPAGMKLNPPAAGGLGACTAAQIGIGNNQPSSCPASSKVGTAEVETPLLDQPLSGSLYVAQPRQNPFGTLLALYLVVEGSGAVVKLPGRVDADQQTGQLTATFDNNPQLPFNEFRVQLNGGAGGSRATLVTPPACGRYSIRTELTSWASATPVVLDSPYVVNENCAVGGFSPEINGGTENPAGGKYSSFALRIIRHDGEQNLAQITATLPEGLVAKLAGVPLCSDALAATGTCPVASQVGTTTIGTGAGSQPLYIPESGKEPTSVYLAGPYRGAPYSLVVRVPAQAGPFDLGNVVVRTALFVNPASAQVTASSDPLPQILEGIPITYRDLRVDVNRPTFILNPTDCAPKRINSVLASATGATASPTTRFQAAGCAGLGFKPKLSLRLTGSTKRAGNPALKAVLKMPHGGANISSVSVVLPRSEFIDNRHINNPCTRPQFNEGKCPANSVLGKAAAYTPLLDRPLAGPVYFRSNGGERSLPDLVADLDGQVHLDVVGFIDSVHRKGSQISRVRNRFATVPDAPVSRFVLSLSGGKKGLLQNSTNLCKGRHSATVKLVAQNGKVTSLAVPLSVPCGKPRGKN